METRTYQRSMFFGSLVLLAGLVGLIVYVRNLPPPLVGELTAKNFEKEVKQSPLPVYINFYLPNKAICEKQEEVVQKLAKEYEGKVRFLKVDASTQKALVQAAGIEAVPAHFLIKPGQGGAYAEGFMDEAKLRQFIEDALKAQPANANPGANPNDPNGPGNNPPADPSEGRTGRKPVWPPGK